MKKDVVVMAISIFLSLSLGCFEGPTGTDGTTGEQGINGTTGEQGTDGTTGEQGIQGLSSLFNVTDEPSGVNCLDGGKKIESGIDANNNNILDVEEVTDTEFVCATTAAVYYGNYNITNDSDITALSSYAIIVGDVYIINTTLTTLNGMQVISAITGSLVIVGNANLTSITAISNCSKIGSIDIQNNSSLDIPIPTFDNITSIKNIYITNNASLLLLHFRYLINANIINISNNSQLLNICMTNLANVNSSFIVSANTKITFFITDVFCYLGDGELRINLNIALSQEYVNDLKNQLITRGGQNWTSENISGNNP